MTGKISSFFTLVALQVAVLFANLGSEARDYKVAYSAPGRRNASAWKAIWEDLLVEEVGSLLSPPAGFFAEEIDTAGDVDSYLNGGADFMFAPAATLSCSPSLQDSVPLVTMKFIDGTDREGGVLFALKDSSLTSLNDLHDKVLAAERYLSWPYMLCDQLMARSGVHSTYDLAQLQFHSTVEDVVRFVRQGWVDFGCLRAGTLERMGAVEEFKILHEVTAPGFPYKLSTETIPGFSLVALPGVDHHVAQRVATALLELQPNHSAAVQAGIGGFSLAGGLGKARNMVESNGVLHRDENGEWDCVIQTVTIQESVVCLSGITPRAHDGPAVVVVGRPALEWSCSSRGLSCPPGARCACRPCYDAAVVRLEPMTSLEALGPCDRMQLCAVTEQRRELHMRVVHNWDGDSAVTYRVQDGHAEGYELDALSYQYKEAAAVRQSGNVSTFAIASNSTGLLIVEVLINTQPITNSPVLVLVTERACAEELREANEVGECVCNAWSMEMTGRCVHTARLLAGTIIASGVLIMVGVILVVRRKLKAARSYWRISQSDLKWPDPPEVIGHNECGDVLKAWYLGTEVAVKCVIQKHRKLEHDVNGFAAIIRRRFSVVNPPTPQHAALASSERASPNPSAHRSQWGSALLPGKAALQQQRSMISRGQWANHGSEGTADLGSPRGRDLRKRRASISGETRGETRGLAPRLAPRRRDSEGGTKAEGSEAEECERSNATTATDAKVIGLPKLTIGSFREVAGEIERAHSMHEVPEQNLMPKRISSLKDTWPRSLSEGKQFDTATSAAPDAAPPALSDAAGEGAPAGTEEEQRPSKRKILFAGAVHNSAQAEGGHTALPHRNSARATHRMGSRRAGSGGDEEGSVRGSRGRRERGERLREHLRQGSLNRTGSERSGVSSIGEDDDPDGGAFWASMKRKVTHMCPWGREPEDEDEESDMDDDDLEEEMKVLTRLRHPCITTVMGIIVTRYDTRIVMEYMCYGSLQDLYLNDMIDFTAELVLPILTDVANGMDFLHSCKPSIIHSDLNAGNVLVDERNRAKVCDFGLSIKRRRWAGSPYWMAPEVLVGGFASKKSDVYAFGITLYEVLARSPPYESEEQDEVMRAVADAEVRKRPVAPADTPVKLKRLMEDCWQSEASQRPSFKEVKRQLEVVDAELREAHARQAKEKARQPRPSESDDIVYGMFPRHVAEALLRGEKVPEDRRDCATVFFSDIVAFTTISSALESHQVSDMLDRLFRRFDDIAAEHGIHKLETIGDCYIGCSNLVENQPDDHARRMALFSLGVQAAAAETLVDPDDPDKGSVRIRVGFDSGPVVGNVVGKRYKKYTIFGNTVNTASRMESSGLPGRIQCTKRAADLLLKQDAGFEVEVRGEVEVKGKGKMTTYFVNAYTPGAGAGAGLPPAVTSPRRGSLDARADSRKRPVNGELGFARAASVATRGGSTGTPASPKGRPKSMEVRSNSGANQQCDLDALARWTAAGERNRTTFPRTTSAKRTLMNPMGRVSSDSSEAAGPAARTQSDCSGASGTAASAPVVFTLSATPIPQESVGEQ